jgi:hypothetical protein
LFCFSREELASASVTLRRRVFLSDRSKGSGEDKMRAPFY